MNKKMTKIVLEFLVSNQDAYAIFSPDDYLVFCNSVFEDLYCYPPTSALGHSFADIVVNAYEKGLGVKIDSSKESIYEWIDKAQLKRRSRVFRIFEVDLVDGRWMLFSEQTNAEGYLFLQAKNITRQKVLESQLNQHVQHLSTLAMLDELTQLPNRRSFITDTNRILNQAAISDCCSLIVVDVDDFKRVNDTYGHHIGDMVLKQVACRLRNTIRPHDLMGRIGGEEFIVFLHNLNLEQAKSAGERIVSCVGDTEFDLEKLSLPVTVSAGLAWQPAPTPFDELYLQADTKLYHAKRSGKNKLST